MPGALLFREKAYPKGKGVQAEAATITSFENKLRTDLSRDPSARRNNLALRHAMVLRSGHQPADNLR
jgi:hypothetical protein